MHWLPTLPRFSDKPASKPSCNIDKLMPKDWLVFSVPPMDWNTKSTGTCCSMSCNVVVRWVKTQAWVGISNRWMRSLSKWFIWAIWRGSSLAGLMPITASPQPYSRPSISEMPMPFRSSAGWLGWMRDEKCPANPKVFLNRVGLMHFLATTIKSWLRIILETAATISGVSPHLITCNSWVVVVCCKSQSLKLPTVWPEINWKATASCESIINRLTSSSS